MDYETSIYILCSVLSFVPALVLHEVSHGFAAYKLGDPTAKRAGRLSLNPMKHIDPFGTVLMPLMLIFLGWPVFGYAKPVPYNPTYFKDPRKGDFIVGLAGPCANLLMAGAAAALAWILLPVYQQYYTNDLLYYFYGMFLQMFALINLYLMFFNLLPIPPLDGSSIIALVIPRRFLPNYYAVQHYAFPIFMLAVVVVPYVFNFNPFSWYLKATAGNLFALMFPPIFF